MDNGFVRACAADVHMDISQEQARTKIDKENARGFVARFVRGRAIEIRMDSQGQSDAGIYRGHAGARNLSAHSLRAPRARHAHGH